jgi:hypothetical protein
MEKTIELFAFVMEPETEGYHPYCVRYVGATYEDIVPDYMQTDSYDKPRD